MHGELAILGHVLRADPVHSCVIDLMHPCRSKPDLVADLLEACAARGEPDEPCIQAVADARAKVLEAIALLEEHAQQTT